MKIICSVIISLIMLLSVNVNAAQTVTKNGYTAVIDWKVTSKKIKIKGLVKKGKKCDELDIRVHLKSRNGKSEYIYSTIKYDTTYGVQFKGRANYYGSRDFVVRKKDWYVKNVRFTCND